MSRFNQAEQNMLLDSPVLTMESVHPGQLTTQQLLDDLLGHHDDDIFPLRTADLPKLELAFDCED